MKKLKYLLFVLSAVVLLSSCKDDNDGPNYGNGGAVGTSVSLKASSPVTIGMKTDYAALDAANYLQTAAANASQTTFGSAMTHGAVVQSDGTLNFSTPDAQMAAVTANGLKVWGRNLCWHQSQNANFIKTFAGLGDPPNVLTINPDFEVWDDNQAVDWLYENGSGTYGNFAKETASANVNKGLSSMSMTIIQAVTSLGSSWRLQLKSPDFPTVVGHNYKVTFWAKASTSGCVAQYEWDHKGSPIYNSTPLETAWKQYTLTFGDGGATPLKATVSSTSIAFDMAYNPVGAVIWIDNVVIIDETQAALDADPVNQIARLNTAFENWVTGMATHYRGQVVGWDVVNELFADNGAIRNNSNTAAPSGATDWFVWSNYLGENIGVKAFSLARAADPNALLFINESGLESNSRKLDALIAYVQGLKSQGAPIDGIGTSMHVNIATAKAGVDYMFQKLAATGLKIRISELSVSVNNVRGFALTPQVLGFQAVTYHDVIASYLANVPAAQRQDITVWGVNDPSTSEGTDFPLLFDNAYVTKPAFDGFLQALK